MCNLGREEYGIPLALQGVECGLLPKTGPTHGPGGQTAEGSPRKWERAHGSCRGAVNVVPVGKQAARQQPACLRPDGHHSLLQGLGGSGVGGGGALQGGVLQRRQRLARRNVGRAAGSGRGAGLGGSMGGRQSSPA